MSNGRVRDVLMFATNSSRGNQLIASVLDVTAKSDSPSLVLLLASSVSISSQLEHQADAQILKTVQWLQYQLAVTGVSL